MRLFNREFSVKRIENKEQRETMTTTTGEVIDVIDLKTLFSNGNPYSLNVSSVYRAVDLITNSVAILPIDNYQYRNNWKYKQYNQLYNLMNIQPNPYQGAFEFKKNIVRDVLLEGNAFIYINRDNDDNIDGLYLLNPKSVTIMQNTDNSIYYYILETGYDIEYSEIIHIKNFTDPSYFLGLRGLSTISYASLALNIAYSSEVHAKNFFESGANMAGILAPKEGIQVTETQAQQAKEKVTKQLNSKAGGKTNAIIVLGSGLQYQPISISPKDSQLLESRQFNILTIAQYFNVPPAKLFDLSKASYNSQEQAQLDFLNTCLLPLLEKIENEMYRKIFLPIDWEFTELKFDVSNLLRLDATTQATVFSQFYQMGAMSTNEIREKLNLNYPVVGGNKHFIQQNLQPIDNLTNDIKNPKNNQQIQQ